MAHPPAFPPDPPMLKVIVILLRGGHGVAPFWIVGDEFALPGGSSELILIRAEEVAAAPLLVIFAEEEAEEAEVSLAISSLMSAKEEAPWPLLPISASALASNRSSPHPSPFALLN